LLCLQTRCLEQLEARDVTLNEQFMPILSRALRISAQLQVLKLENCNLSGHPIIILGELSYVNPGWYVWNLKVLLQCNFISHFSLITAVSDGVTIAPFIIHNTT
jgi:hypothetical protein